MLAWVLFFGHHTRWLAMQRRRQFGRFRHRSFSLVRGTPSPHSLPRSTVVLLPALTEGFLFCAISVAISRILLGMYFVSDVIAGALIGRTIGWAAFLL